MGMKKILPLSTKQEKYYKSNKKISHKKISKFKEPYYRKSKSKRHSNKIHKTLSKEIRDKKTWSVSNMAEKGT